MTYNARRSETGRGQSPFVENLMEQDPAHE